MMITPLASMNGASWGDDDTIVFADGTGQRGLFRVPAAGGQAQRLLEIETDKGETDQRFPFVLPGSRAVLFTSMHGADPRQMEVAVLDLRTLERRTLIKGGFAPRYTPSGHLLYAQTNTLLAVPFDPGRLEVRGTPRPVQEGIGTNRPPGPITASRTPARWFTHPAAPPPSRVAWSGSAAMAATSARSSRPISDTTVPAHFAGWPPPRLEPCGRPLGLRSGRPAADQAHLRRRRVHCAVVDGRTPHHL